MWLMKFFFFSSRRRHTRFDCDWSSDVCSSDLYTVAGEFIDSADAGVCEFARRASAGSGDDVSLAVKLYYAVRDEILYDPYYAGDERRYFRGSDCLRAKRGFCIPKAALLAAAARS